MVARSCVRLSLEYEDDEKSVVVGVEDVSKWFLKIVPIVSTRTTRIVARPSPDRGRAGKLMAVGDCL